MKAVFKISYYLRSNYKNKSGKCPIMIRTSLNGKICNVGSSGLSIKPELWNTKFNRMSGKTSETLIFNNRLDGISNLLNNLFEKVFIHRCVQSN
ncbi:Arm DNA-binding domain-containing protein [Bacteroides heparinolyticus]|uniref:Arm DNA-binding domain-containing protein n=1 Tax=Prevotella heparinolytica TaxID=28113 RepID=UPI00359F822C